MIFIMTYVHGRMNKDHLHNLACMHIQDGAEKQNRQHSHHMLELCKGPDTFLVCMQGNQDTLDQWYTRDYVLKFDN